MTQIQDITWYGLLREAQEVARARNLPIAIKALGQGTDPNDAWCPAASATRAMALSDPRVTSLIQRRFVPVRFSMWLVGPATDLFGRDFVLKDGHYPYPGLIVTDPDLQVIARTRSTESAEDTLVTLQQSLAARPDLAPRGAEPDDDLYDLADPAQRDFVALDARFNRSAQLDRPALIPAFEAWLGAHAERLPDVAAIAQTLLADCCYLARDFLRAESLWADVVARHPRHPIRHRASFNLLDKDVWPEETHHALRGQPRPGVAEHAPVVPYPEVRARNLAAVAHDPRYVRSPGGLAFVEVPAGTFTMGGSPAIYQSELPLRRVTLSKPYLLAAWPVTRAVWKQFDPSAWPGLEGEGLAGELPHTHVPWHRANEFCAWLSARDGWRYRLPTEAEWERAARGGLEGARYPWGDDPIDPTRANYDLPRMVPVGCYPPNAYGLFDMIGNCSEYCADRFMGGAYGLTPPEVVDPTGPTAEQQPRDLRAVRASLVGSTFNEMIAYTSWRAGTDADRGGGGFGFRPVAEP